MGLVEKGVVGNFAILLIRICSTKNKRKLKTARLKNTAGTLDYSHLLLTASICPTHTHTHTNKPTTTLQSQCKQEERGKNTQQRNKVSCCLPLTVPQRTKDQTPTNGELSNRMTVLSAPARRLLRSPLPSFWGGGRTQHQQQQQPQQQEQSGARTLRAAQHVRLFVLLHCTHTHTCTPSIRCSSPFPLTH